VVRRGQRVVGLGGTEPSSLAVLVPPPGHWWPRQQHAGLAESVLLSLSPSCALRVSTGRCMALVAASQRETRSGTRLSTDVSADSPRHEWQAPCGGGRAREFTTASRFRPPRLAQNPQAKVLHTAVFRAGEHQWDGGACAVVSEGGHLRAACRPLLRAGRPGLTASFAGRPRSLHFRVRRAGVGWNRPAGVVDLSRGGLPEFPLFDPQPLGSRRLGLFPGASQTQTQKEGNRSCVLATMSCGLRLSRR
jgi:hypothetical protein